MSPFGATVIAVGLNFVSFRPDSSGNGSLQDDLAGVGVELDPLGVRVASAVDELGVPFVANLHVVACRVLVAQVLLDHLAVGREDDDPLVRADVDVAVLVDHDAAVRAARVPKMPSGRSPQPGTVSKVMSPQPMRTGFTGSAAETEVARSANTRAAKDKPFFMMRTLSLKTRMRGAERQGCILIESRHKPQALGNEAEDEETTTRRHASMECRRGRPL